MQDTSKTVRVEKSPPNHVNLNYDLTCIDETLRSSQMNSSEFSHTPETHGLKPATIPIQVKMNTDNLKKSSYKASLHHSQIETVNLSPRRQII